METPLTQHISINRPSLNLKDYVSVGGYQAVHRAITMAPQEITKMVQDSNLKGRGGAGFNTGMKWSFVPMNDAAQTKYLIANADEMEPGTFKDRLLLEGNPHQLIEGMIVSAYAIQANISYVFLRWAYNKAARLIRYAIDEAYAAGYLGKNILGTGFNLEIALAYRYWQIHVRRRNRPFKCPGRKAGHSPHQTSIPTGKRFIWQTHNC